MRPSVLMVLIVLCAVPVAAVDIQYTLATLDVITANDTPIESAAGYGIVTIVDVLSADLVWPVPTGSPNVATCGTGKPEWTRLTNPNGTTIAALGLVVRPDLLWFHTTSPLLAGCYDVATKNQVKTLMDQAIITAANSLETLIQALAGVNTWKNELCPPTNNNANCVVWRASADTVNARYPSRVQGATLAADMATLVNDGYGFIDAQCKASPGGGFC